MLSDDVFATLFCYINVHFQVNAIWFGLVSDPYFGSIVPYPASRNLRFSIPTYQLRAFRISSMQSRVCRHCKLIDCIDIWQWALKTYHLPYGFSLPLFTTLCSFLSSLSLCSTIPRQLYRIYPLPKRTSRSRGGEAEE